MNSHRGELANKGSYSTVGTSFAFQTLFDEAVRHHRAGRLGVAEQLYRQILAVDERHADSLHLLGVVAHQTGRDAVAADLIARAIRLRGNDPSYHSNLGNVLQSQGKLGDAVARYRRAIALKPDHADAHNNLGNARQSQGRIEDAITHYRRAIAIEPKYVQAHNNLGNALRAQNKLAEAEVCYRRAIALHPDYAEAHNNLANVLKAQDRLAEAVTHYERAIALKPDAAEVHVNLGAVRQLQGRSAEAATHYERAIALGPGHAEAHGSLGSALEQQGRLAEAIGQYRRAVALKPDAADIHVNLGNALQREGDLAGAASHYAQAIALRPDLAEAHNNLGNVFKDQDRLAEAMAQYERAIALRPDYAEAYNNLGNAYVIQGRIEEARHAYQAAIDRAPRGGVYYRQLSSVRRAVAGDRYVAAMEALAQDMPSLPARDQQELHFALGKTWADLEQYERSFRHFLAGNALRRREVVYDEADALDMFERIRGVFTAELMRGRRNAGEPSPSPVFIVGMPRSGTTLVEQILASHPQVFGAGERREFDRGVAALVARNGGVPFPEIVPLLLDEQYQRLGADYLAAVGGGASGAARITDKMPDNFRYLGLIHLALPGARIIHVRRDPVDTCLSCFMVAFETGQPFSYDLGELGRYHRGYDAMMAHWRRVLPPGAMLEVRYEDVVADVEREAQRIVAHCGLAWDDACLAFHRTQRPVWTASAIQVRQPIYRTSVGRRRPYLAFLDPLIRELGLAGEGED